MNGGADLLARYLRQRRELGETELILDPATIARLRSREALPDSSKPETPPMRGSDKDAGGQPRAIEATGDTSRRPVNLTNIRTLDELAEVASTCPACRLADTRTQVVFADGDPHARLVVAGEAPGADEDRIGRPFVGRAGKFLDQLLLSSGFPRETVYICNVIKCRPPRNRNPHQDEVHACSPYLRMQLDFVKPRVILAVGTFAAQTLLETTEPIGRLRGSVHEYRGIPLVPTYHPAALLRNPAWIRPAWEDVQRARDVLER